MPMPEQAVSDVLIAKLAVHLGPHVARVAILTFAAKAGIPRGEPLTAVHVPDLLAEIRPILKVMIGQGNSEAVVADIERATLGTMDGGGSADPASLDASMNRRRKRAAVSPPSH